MKSARVPRSGVLALMSVLLTVSGAARAQDKAEPQAPAAVAYQTINSAGPLNKLFTGIDASTQIAHTTDGIVYEVYPPSTIPGDYGTFLVVGGVLYAPDFTNHGGTATGGLGTRTAFTPVSQSAVLGSGTPLDPHRVVTVVDAGTTGLRITQTDSYVVGQESYRTDVVVSNTSGAPKNAILYRALDCYLGSSDFGYGFTDPASGSVGCSVNANNTPPDRIEELVPLNSGSKYFQAYYGTVWTYIGTKAEFPNTCQCATDLDNGAGLSWSISVPAGGQITRSNLTVFSPIGTRALKTAKTADSPTSGLGTANGYTITVTNPNTVLVNLNSIVDDLPTGFTYTTGSTTGVTTANPVVAGQRLTWSGPFGVPAGGTVTLHFAVTVPTIAGTYLNQATADAGTTTVAGTGPTAPIEVHAILDLTSIEPTSGPSIGGTGVTITGAMFQEGVSVKIGGADCAVTDVTETTIDCTTGPRAPDTVEVLVKNPDGGTGVLSEAYTYFCDGVQPTADVSGASTICTPGSSRNVTVTLTGTPPWKLVWSDGFVQTGIMTSPHIRSVTPAVSTLYQVFAVADVVCANAGTGGANIIVAQPLAASVVASEPKICPGSGVTIQAILSGTAPFQVTWSDGAVQMTSAAVITRVVNPTSTRTYSITALTDANGCTATLAGSVTVTVVQPSAVITAPSAVCPSSLGHTASVPDAGPGATYQWVVTGGSITGGAGTTSITFSANNGPTLTIGITINAPPGCLASSNKQLGVSKPSATILGNSTIYAAPSASITIGLQGTPPWTLTWSDGFVQSAIPTSPTERTVTPLRETAYSLVSVTNGTCSGNVAGSVTVIPQGVGDVNASGEVDVADIFYLINYLFANGPAPQRSGDANADGSVSVGDIFYLISYLFANGPPPPG